MRFRKTRSGCLDQGTGKLQSLPSGPDSTLQLGVVDLFQDDPELWSGRDALGKQIMGNMTPSQFQAIHKPTQPRITGGSPAMIRHNDLSPAMVRREQ